MFNYLLSDIDECAEEDDNCHSNAICTNLPGNFSCDCQLGYMGDGIESCIGTYKYLFVLFFEPHQSMREACGISFNNSVLNHSIAPHQMSMNAWTTWETVNKYVKMRLEVLCVAVKMALTWIQTDSIVLVRKLGICCCHKLADVYLKMLELLNLM